MKNQHHHTILNRFIYWKYLLFFIVSTSLITKMNAQSQVGNTVFKSINDSRFGSSISINDLGNIVAVGARYTSTVNGDSGIVRIYELNNINNLWEPKGNDILGDNNGDSFGSSISLDSSGNILAIGAPTNDDDGFQSGLVKIFEYNNSNKLWEQKGNNIYSGLNDFFSGSSVSLNASGTRLAIGTPASEIGGGVGLHNGHIMIYDFDSNTNKWNQVGNTILGVIDYSNLGYSVAINDSGNTVIAGCPGIYLNGNPPINGEVKVYELINNSWVQKGDVLIGSQVGDRFGGNVDINYDGNTIIIGALLNSENGNYAGMVEIFEFDGLEWIIKGEPIIGQTDDKFGHSIKIDSFGDKILVGSSGFNNNLGKVELFQFRNDNWNKIGDAILGDSVDDVFGSESSMTRDGNYIVSCSLRNDDVNDFFKVYYTSNETLSITEFEILYNLKLYFKERDLIIESNNLIIKDVRAFNILGQELNLIFNESNFSQIRFSDYLDTGVYFIKIISDKGILSKKVLLNNI